MSNNNPPSVLGAVVGFTVAFVAAGAVYGAIWAMLRFLITTGGAGHVQAGYAASTLQAIMLLRNPRDVSKAASTDDWIAHVIGRFFGWLFACHAIAGLAVAVTP